MMATCPVESGVANAGPLPPELAVDTWVNTPWALMEKDCRAPTVSSFVALEKEIQHLVLRKSLRNTTNYNMLLFVG